MGGGALLLPLIAGVTEALSATTPTGGPLQPSNESHAPLPIVQPHMLTAPVLTLADEIGVIENVEPPSGTMWVWVGIVASAIAGLLFVIELVTFNLPRVCRDLRKPKPPNEAGDTAETGVPQPNKWWAFAVMLLVVAATDLYSGMPATFFPGEAQQAGLSVSYAGCYLGASAITALLVSPFAGQLMAVVHPNVVQRLAVSLIAVTSIPQGLANHLGPASFVALTFPLRLIEGITYGLSETAILASIFYLFPPSQVTLLMGIFTGLRGMIGAAAPVVGAALYKGSGMAAPYLFVGCLNIVTAVLVRCVMRDLPPQGKPRASVGHLLKIWRLVAANVSMFVIFTTTSAITVLAQPWLGVAPLGFNSLEIATALVVMALTTMFSAVFVGSAIAHVFGPTFGLWLGHLPIICGLALIGSPPKLLPALSPSTGLVYAALVLCGSGMGIALPAGISVFVLCIIDEGLSKRETSAPLGVLTAMVPFAAAAIGPAVAGVLAAAMGVASTAVACVLWMTASLILSIVAHARYLGVRSPEEDEVVDKPPSAERHVSFPAATVKGE